jgi:hypothetical protein
VVAEVNSGDSRRFISSEEFYIPPYTFFLMTSPNDVICIGGVDKKSNRKYKIASKMVLHLNFVHDTYRALPKLANERYFASCCTILSKIYVFGGNGSNKGMFGSIQMKIR